MSYPQHRICRHALRIHQNRDLKVYLAVLGRLGGPGENDSYTAGAAPGADRESRINRNSKSNHIYFCHELKFPPHAEKF